MEVLFENRYVRDKQLAKEIYRYWFFQRKWLIVIYVLFSLSFLANLLGAIFEGDCDWSVLVVVPLFFAIQVFGYYHHVNTMLKRDAEVHGKEISVETIVTNAYIQNTAATGSVNKLEYDKIKSVMQTKNLILRKAKANLIYIFRKDTFTKGSKDEFIAFLREKGIKIK